ncbi:DUF6146 family protein [Flavobacterium sp. GNP001]
MKRSLYILGIIALIMYSCATTTPLTAVKIPSNNVASDTIRIANEELEYEVIIIEPGFNAWLNGNALPRNYHTQSFLENKNRLYITEWNNRVLQPMRFDPNLYEMTINYDPTINYGYEVNYLIYNYMIFFQNTYKQQLYGFVPIR